MLTPTLHVNAAPGQEAGHPGASPSSLPALTTGGPLLPRHACVPGSPGWRGYHAATRPWPPETATLLTNGLNNEKQNRSSVQHGQPVLPPSWAQPMHVQLQCCLHTWLLALEGMGSVSAHWPLAWAMNESAAVMMRSIQSATVICASLSLMPAPHVQLQCCWLCFSVWAPLVS